MSKAIERRLKAVESGNDDIPLEVRAWLGQMLTDTEKAILAAMPDEPYIPPTKAALALMPHDVREWISQPSLEQA